MNRSTFIHTVLAQIAVMSQLSQLKKLAATLPLQDTYMPALFIGHGSPMNGITDNEFSKTWQQLGKTIPQPKAVLCISAHWLTKGTSITAMDFPKTIHDFGGFPEALYAVQYPAPGDIKLAEETAALIKYTPIGLDHEWGLDHGCWSVVRHMYPHANIPVLQLSIDYQKPAQYHYELAKELGELRKKGVLIIGSGNMVHNLGRIAWQEPESFAFDWAIEMNTVFKDLITDKNHQPLIRYESLNKAAALAIPTPDHYLPLLYVLGMQRATEKVSFFNDKVVMGSITMTSVQISD